MALICRFCIFKCPTGLIFRVSNTRAFLPKCLKFSTSVIMQKSTEKSPPVKYTTSKVAKVEIAETIGFKEKVEEKEKTISTLIMLCSLIIFMIYFCIIREENDIDEILKGGEEGKMMLPELAKLKMDLIYCQKMKLPTDAIKARIEELEKEKKHKSPFIK